MNAASNRALTEYLHLGVHQLTLRCLQPDVLILRHLEAGNPSGITVLDDVLTTGAWREKAGIIVCAKDL